MWLTVEMRGCHRSYDHRIRLIRYYREKTRRFQPIRREIRQYSSRRDSNERRRSERSPRIRRRFDGYAKSSSPYNRRRSSPSPKRRITRRCRQRRSVPPTKRRRSCSKTSKNQSRNRIDSKPKENLNSFASKEKILRLPTPQESPTSLLKVAESAVLPVEPREKVLSRKRKIKRRILNLLPRQESPVVEPKIVVLQNFQVESRFAETFTYFMLGRRFVISQSQICSLANRVMNELCVDDDGFPLFETSSLNSKWLEKFCARYPRVCQFIDGMNGNWFWRKSRLSKGDLDECFQLCKACLKQTLHATDLPE